MGVLTRIQKILNGPENTGHAFSYSLRSPDSSGALAAALIPDSVGLPEGRASVGEALAVPAISRGVDLYTAAISQLTFAASEESPSTRWLNWTEGPISPALRNVDLALDLLFERWACLAVARDADGYVENGIRIPPHMWDFDSDGLITVGGKAVPQDEVLFVPSFKRLGLLDYAASTIRQYLNICRTMTDRTANPTPLIGLAMDATADPDEAAQAQEDWHSARTSPNGAVAIIPPGIKLETPGADKDDSALMIGARNAIRLDAANYMNLPAAMLDGNSGTTDQYSNTLQNTNEFLKLSVSLFTLPLAARFSQDDVTRPGVKVSMDTSTFDAFVPAKGNVGTATAAQPNQSQNGALTHD